MTQATEIDSLLDFCSVEAFYARHWTLADEGLGEEFAETFTEDGEWVWENYAMYPDPARGRAAISALVKQATSLLASKGNSHPQHFNVNPVIAELGGGRVRVTSYQIALDTYGERPVLRGKAHQVDELVRHEGSFLVHRRVNQHTVFLPLDRSPA
jgi:bifunctional aromatase (cyclase/dehydratase)